MNHSLVVPKIAIGAALLFAVSARLPAADELPKAEALLDKYVEVTGGKAAYEKHHTEVISGAMEFLGNGLQGSLTSYSAEPDRHYLEVNIAGVGKIQEGSDGTVAWSYSALQGPHIKEGAEKAEALRQGRFNPELNWRSSYKRAETAGVESVDGKDCYKVVLTPNEGEPMTRYYDRQSNLLVRMVMTVTSPLGQIPVESAVSDYRKEGEILMPHKVRQKGAGQEIAITIESVRYNVEFPKDRFDPPEEIKALLNKK